MKQVQEIQAFQWPHFTDKIHGTPTVSWSSPEAETIIADDYAFQVMNEAERKDALAVHGKKLSSNSRVDVGDIHRYLCQPFENEDILYNNLMKATAPALYYVLIDLSWKSTENPQNPGYIPSKDALSKMLIKWVCLFISELTLQLY